MTLVEVTSVDDAFGLATSPAASRRGPAPLAEHSVLDRTAAARALLRRVEREIGVRATRPIRPGNGEPARRRSHETAREPTREPTHESTHERFWPVPEVLAPLLPFGALQRGTAVEVRGSTALLLTLLTGPSGAGAWSAVVGFPALGVLAAVDAGVDLDRLAVVPRPGPDAAAVVAALVDGVDIVVVGPDAPLLDSDRRRLLARARERGATLVSACPWPGAHVVLTAGEGTWAGVDRGAGWLRRRTLRVERGGRAGAARSVTVEVDLPVGGERLAYSEPYAEPTSEFEPELLGRELRLVG